MTCIEASLPPRVLPTPELFWAESQVSQCLAPGHYRLSDGRLAQQAASCLLTPEPGDGVLLVQAPSGRYITQVLWRNQSARAQLSVPGAQVLAIAQGSVELNGTQQIALRSLGDVELTSAHGAVSLNARHILSSAAETMVHNAQHLVTHVQHFVLQVTQLLRVHGRQALITAEQDMKLDAERISLG